MGFTTAHLRDALERPAPPAPLQRYPYREPAPLHWLYRADPLLRLALFAAPLVALILIAGVAP
jgi:hypothetical protein